MKELILNDLKNLYQDFVEQNWGSPNDSFELAKLGTEATVYLEKLKSRGQISAFEVVCDASNNPPSVKDTGKPQLDVQFTTPALLELGRYERISIGPKVR